jgi:hypothetical protein
MGLPDGPEFRVSVQYLFVMSRPAVRQHSHWTSETSIRFLGGEATVFGKDFRVGDWCWNAAPSRIRL